MHTGSIASLLTLLSGLSALHAQGPVISEFVARNASGIRDARGELSDWVEIHNPGGATLSLTGLYLTDDPADLTKWRFSSRQVAAGGFEVVFFSGRSQRISGQPLHVDAKLSGAGEYLALVHSDGVTVLSEFAPKYPQQYPDKSYGRANNTGAERYFDVPTPGTANGAGYTSIAHRVAASAERGFYAAPLSVGLASTTAGATIRFTTDGSRPTRGHGTVYSRPLQISGTTIVRATAFTAAHLASEVSTFSYIFHRDVLNQGKAPPGFPVTWGTRSGPTGPVPTPADYEMDPRIVNDPYYGPRMLSSLESLPSISLVASVTDLFDANTGIYSNPLGAGEAWERPASMEIFYPRMGRHQQADGGVRITGRGSRNPKFNPKHSFRLLFKDSYGAKDLEADLFGPGAARAHDTIALRSVYNDSFAGVWIGVRDASIYVRDQFVRDTQGAIGQSTPRGMFCHLYVNGLYWGLYNPTERPDAEFQASYFGGVPADYDVLKHFNGVVLSGDKVAFDAALGLARGGLASAAAYDQFRNLVDVQNLTDYMLVQFFCGTLDWPHNNWYAARRRLAGNGFRFFVWDAEPSLLDVNANLLGTKTDESPGILYFAARANPEYRMLFADRAHRALFHGGALTATNCLTRFRRRVEEVRLSIIAASARWGDVVRSAPFTYLTDWVPDVDHELNNFFPQRPAVFLNQLRAAGLYPNVHAPEFSQHGGAISPGQTVTMSAPAGQIYFAVGGADPRATGGGIAAGAQAYSGSITLTQSATVKARVLDNGTWSALNEATFVLPSLVINEILAKNETGIKDEAQEREDWIELINSTTRPITASGMFLTDDLLDPMKWPIPPGYVLNPGEAVIVWADNDTTQGPLHATFKLSVDGESVFLFDTDGATMLSGFHFGAQVADVSLGYLRDADGPLVTYPEPSPGQTNEIQCGRRLFSGRSHDLHPMQLDTTGSVRLGGAMTFAMTGAAPNVLTLFQYAMSATYLEPLSPNNDVALLLAPPLPPGLILNADPQGELTLPFGIPNDPNLIGLHLYFQMFSFASGVGVRGSNALEIAICR